ncbi:hypothetical protein ACLKA6_010137 [Drosophila palustris]
MLNEIVFQTSLLGRRGRGAAEEETPDARCVVLILPPGPPGSDLGTESSRSGDVRDRPPDQIRGQKTERTKILSTNPGQVFPGLIPGEGSRKESGTDQDSIPKPPPGYQVQPQGLTVLILWQQGLMNVLPEQGLLDLIPRQQGSMDVLPEQGLLT